jgi:hypothetical protein
VTRVLVEAAHARIDRVEGPLKGHHHQTYAVPVDAASPLAGEFRWLKLREPREVRWYDMRQFAAEEQVTEQLHGRLPRIPRVLRMAVGAGRLGTVTLAEFIEGTTLDRLPVRGRPVPERFLRQLAELFAALGAVEVGPFLGRARAECECGGAGPGERDSSGFLRQLVHFTVRHVYEGEPGPGLPETGGLFRELGVAGGAVEEWAARAPRLTAREPRLLHGDLHRRNLVVDRRGALWPIDWDLALVGDPLYELATHLHLMDYPVDQEAEVVRRWREAVGPGASRGTAADLPHYLDFKRLQSVCTDVVRGAARVAEAAARAGHGAEVPGGELRRAAAGVRKALAGARGVLGLEKVPPLVAVEAAFEAWWRRRRG